MLTKTEKLQKKYLGNIELNKNKETDIYLKTEKRMIDKYETWVYYYLNICSISK